MMRFGEDVTSWDSGTRGAQTVMVKDLDRDAAAIAVIPAQLAYSSNKNR
jgi:hypothetical protein